MISLRWGAFDIDSMADNRNTQLTVVPNRPELRGIVPILLENPEHRLDFSRDKNIPLCTSALTSQRAEKYMFVKLSQYFL